MTPFTTSEVFPAGFEVPALIQAKLDELTTSEYFPLMDPSGYRAILNIIAHGLQNGWSPEQINTFLFNPIVPTQEHVDVFRARHEQIYAEQAVGLAQQVFESHNQFFSISSSMYAGKSTLAAEVCSNLSNMGIRVMAFVPDFMVPDEDLIGDTTGEKEEKPKTRKAGFITLRGKTVKPGDIVGEDGFTRIEAQAYAAAQCETFFKEQNINPTEKVVIHFDEYSFMGAEDVLYFINYIKQNYPNVKVLFVGLNRNALGQELAGYTAIKEVVAAEIVCKSFVPNILQNIDHLCEPSGTFTSRYVVLPNGFHVLDCGFLPVVVPKEFKIVYYTPSNYEHHMYNILLGMGQTALLSSIVEPDEMQQGIRANLFNALTSVPVVQEQ